MYMNVYWCMYVINVMEVIFSLSLQSLPYLYFDIQVKTHYFGSDATMELNITGVDESKAAEPPLVTEARCDIPEGGAEGVPAGG